MGRIDQDRDTWPGTWTWDRPVTFVAHVGMRNLYRRRTQNYALWPEPTITTELLRRGFLEGA